MTQNQNDNDSKRKSKEKPESKPNRVDPPEKGKTLRQDFSEGSNGNIQKL